ncbi:low-affinity Fe(II) transport protein [Basidiobolus meristosporus CBS 931.73]|uniref:Low-affinity Fe(II) transport protein n=1 Tax=Basidiobolus meristosporus CBS 931.73 TaxID=1314790 RepID=A0A1Y1YH89_9FUNG|nr:low-affinity Fe(II) transport protein [Basidiobolus meristosporus CBS 931.73]|eukprot:ORX97339.1 low-affinity Fe(II) transport protein [Basidiobolus meristosporus CBS 931.73]
MSAPDHSDKRFGERVLSALCSPGKQYAVQSAAPTQFISINKAETVYTVGEEIPESTPWIKQSLGGRLFDSVTKYAGSRVMFVLTLAVLAGWSIVGIVLHAPANWQIAIQDGGSIQCYISDTLLMRQQQNHCHRLLTIIAQLRSRNATFNRLVFSNDLFKGKNIPKVAAMGLPKDVVGDAANLPLENWFDRTCNWVSITVGSIYSLFFYWVGIFVWIGAGSFLQWSNMWQLYINTAIAVELTFTSMFLQNTRRRHMEYFEKCLTSVIQTDQDIEILLRRIDGDNTPNPSIVIEPLKVSLGVRSIDYYADLVGSGVGVVISITVFVVWIAIGNCMQWNSNWWLIIGTYTGLVGFVDGFILRNVYFRQDKIMNEQLDVLIDADLAIFQYLNLAPPTQSESCKSSLITRMSNFMGNVCSMPEAVLASVLVTVALLCIASGMDWNETGQLLCNTPTMIIEGFLFIVLIQAHNMSNTKRRIQLHDILLRRLKLHQFLLSVADQSKYTEKGSN